MSVIVTNTVRGLDVHTLSPGVKFLVTSRSSLPLWVMISKCLFRDYRGWYLLRQRLLRVGAVLKSKSAHALYALSMSDVPTMTFAPPRARRYRVSMSPISIPSIQRTASASASVTATTPGRAPASATTATISASWGKATPTAPACC